MLVCFPSGCGSACLAVPSPWSIFLPTGWAFDSSRIIPVELRIKAVPKAIQRVCFLSTRRFMTHSSPVLRGVGCGPRREVSSQPFAGNPGILDFVKQRAIADPEGPCNLLAITSVIVQSLQDDLSFSRTGSAARGLT